MRTTWMNRAARVLAGAGLVLVLACTARCGAGEAPAAGAAAAIRPATAAVPQRRLVSMDLVDRVQFSQALQRLPPGTVVLDLEALESLDAALDLVAAARRRGADDAPLICWLATPDHGPALAEAWESLSAQGCSVLRVVRATLASR